MENAIEVTIKSQAVWSVLALLACYLRPYLAAIPISQTHPSLR